MDIAVVADLHLDPLGDAGVLQAGISASLRCSSDRVIEVTFAPRGARRAATARPSRCRSRARRSRLVTPAASSSRSILRCWAVSRSVASATDPACLGSLVNKRRAVGHRRVQEHVRTARWRGRSGGRCCASGCGCDWSSAPGWRSSAAWRRVCRDGGMRLATSRAKTVSTPARSSASQSPAMYASPKPTRPGAAEPSIERVRSAQQHHRAGEPAGAQHLPARQQHVQRQPTDDPGEQPPGDRGAGLAGGHGRDVRPPDRVDRSDR